MKNLVTIVTMLLLLSFVTLASAHEFIIVPQQWENYHEGQKVPFSIASSHSFMRSEEMEAAESVSATYNKSTITLFPNDSYQTWDGSVILKGGGAALITGHRKGEVWSKTTTGWKKGDKSSLKGVLLTRKYEKFAKSLLPVDGKTNGFDTKTEQLLEIIPLDNPLTAKVGDEIRVKLLYNGAPVSPEAVTATYNGFTDNENTYAYFTEPYGNGLAKIRLSAPGLWMVRIQHVVNVKGQSYESHVLRATLTFPVGK